MNLILKDLQELSLSVGEINLWKFTTVRYVERNQENDYMSIGNGRKTYSDSTLKSMTKDELIDIIRCLESNIRNAYEENDIQYENCKRLLSEERNKTLDEIVNQIDEFQDFLSGGEYDYFPEDDIKEWLKNKKIIT